jgi:iron-sulfur cluster assembly protein
MIQLTEIAAKKVLKHIEKRGQGIGIVVGVRTTGCSGLAYKLEYIDTPFATRDWMTYESNGVTVWINGKDLPYVNGLTMDYKRQGLNEGFEFINPNETARCGCGESFKV